MRTKKRNGLAAPAAIILAAACIIGANTAAARIDDLTGQRDIYRSRAINWETEALEAEEQVQELKAQLAASQQASTESAVHSGTPESSAARRTARRSTSISAAPATGSLQAAPRYRQASRWQLIPTFPLRNGPLY